MKALIRGDARLRRCLHYASYSRARRLEIPKNADGNRVGKGVERGFGVVMVELMLRKRALIKGCQSLNMYAKRWRELAEEQVKRFPDAHTLIFLFDDETNVPLAKLKTQKKRRDDLLSPEELRSLGPYKYLCNTNPTEFDRQINDLFEAEALQRIRDKLTPMSPFEIFMGKHMKTGGLREDHFEFATRWAVAGAYADLGAGRRIIVDRGVWRASFERRIEDDPYEGGQEDWSSVTRSFAGAHESNMLRESGDSTIGGGDDGAHRAWILMDRWGVRKMDAMEGQHLVGEADLKIPRYARLFAGQDVFVVCHDTDDLPILLLAAKDWVPPEGRIPGRLWLDLTTLPHDEHPRLPKPKKPKKGQMPPPPPMLGKDGKLPPRRGVVDILQLWRDIHHWFAEDYPQVSNPVEVFCWFLAATGTDYLKNPPRMRAPTLWKAFHNHRLCNELAGAVMTDGHMGSALPTDPETALLIDGRGFPQAPSAAEAMDWATRALLRDPTRGAFYRPDQGGRGPEHCPQGHQARLIACKESAMVGFLLRANDKVGPKDATRWPKREWMQAWARRLGWQLAYWYGGDTIEGRDDEDEMAYAEDHGVSVRGWHWAPDPDSECTPEEMGTFRPASHRKRKAGCLGRPKPRGMLPEESPTVLELAKLCALRRARKRPKT